VQELQDKARRLPRTIRWHFIGGLQTNKCRPLAESVPNLWCVASVDSAKKAEALERGRAALVAAAQPKESGGEDATGGEPLRVMVQVNTSGEAEKSGCAPGEPALALCRLVRERCPHLRLQGLMTIGAIARSRDTSGAENEDFKVLVQVREQVCAELGIPLAELELSMGMSSDYETAIEMGSDEVRVGSTIFGERPPKKDAKVLEEPSQAS
jgi:PLP dependent protein